MGKTRTFFLIYNVVLEPKEFIQKIVDMLAKKERTIEQCVWSEDNEYTYIFLSLNKKIKISNRESLAIMVGDNKIIPKRFYSKSKLLVLYFISILDNAYHEFGIDVSSFLKRNKYKLKNKIKELKLNQ